jgi:hypothetical protein
VISRSSYLTHRRGGLDFVSPAAQIDRQITETKLGGYIMNSLFKAVALAVAIAAPVASFAQSNQPVTRAEVRAQLVQLEKAGYNPSLGSDPHYPADIQAAEARVAQAQGAAAATDVGGVTAGASASGHAATVANNGVKSIYFGQ